MIHINFNFLSSNVKEMKSSKKRLNQFEYFKCKLNIYNANTEKEQVRVLNEPITILSNFENIHNHNVIFAGDFNIFFDAALDAKGGSLTLKRCSINKLIELKTVNALFDKNIYLELFNEDQIAFSSQKISKNMLKNLMF